MRVVNKFFRVSVARNLDIASKFIGVIVVWLRGMSPTSKYKRNFILDLLITKFTTVFDSYRNHATLICDHATAIATIIAITRHLSLSTELSQKMFLL